MKKQIAVGFALIAAVLLIACQSEKPQSGEHSELQTTAQTDSTADMQSAAHQSNSTSGEGDLQEPAEDEIQEFGIIESIEDSGYPMFVVTVDFPDRQMKSTFNLNIEEIAMDMAALTALEGKYATIYYLSEMENDLNDLQVSGTSVLGEWAPEINPDWLHITGFLSGAEAETTGDLPGVITITDDTGNQIHFKYFITPEMVEANGTVVTAFYSYRNMETITYLRASEE